MNLQPIKEFPNLETYDVIANNKIALVVAKDGLYQYDYSDINNIHFISKTRYFKITDSYESKETSSGLIATLIHWLHLQGTEKINLPSLIWQGLPPVKVVVLEFYKR